MRKLDDIIKQPIYALAPTLNKAKLKGNISWNKKKVNEKTECNCHTYQYLVTISNTLTSLVNTVAKEPKDSPKITAKKTLVNTPIYGKKNDIQVLNKNQKAAYPA